MAVFKINGVTLLPGSVAGVDGTAPSGHYITNEPPNLVKTAGGVVAVEPASGNARTHVWTFSRRTTRAVRAILNAINAENGGLVVIDTPGVTKVGYGAPEQYTGVVCTVHLPDFRVESNNSWVSDYELVFSETYPQT